MDTGTGIEGLTMKHSSQNQGANEIILSEPDRPHPVLFFRQSVRIPVIANGDVMSRADFDLCLEKTGN